MVVVLRRIFQLSLRGHRRRCSLDEDRARVRRQRRHQSLRGPILRRPSVRTRRLPRWNAGLDLLIFSWTYRFFSILFFLLASYAFVQGIYSTSPRKWIAFFFAATGNAVVLMTNGSPAVVSSVVFLGVLMSNSKRNANDLSTRSVLLLAVTAGATLLLAFAFNNNTLVLTLLIAGLLGVRILSNTGKYAGLLFLGCVWPATLLLAHRGSFLFVPTVPPVGFCILPSCG